MKNKWVEFTSARRSLRIEQEALEQDEGEPSFAARILEVCLVVPVGLHLHFFRHRPTSADKRQASLVLTTLALYASRQVVSAPLVLLMKYTIPDCRVEEKRRLYPLTFTMSIVWIGLLSFLMVDIASRAGCILGWGAH